MNRETFLNELMAGLTQLGPVEQRQVADYYNELIFDGVENGKPEEEIIAGFGAPEEIAAQIRAEYKSQQAVEGDARAGRGTASSGMSGVSRSGAGAYRSGGRAQRACERARGAGRRRAGVVSAEGKRPCHCGRKGRRIPVYPYHVDFNVWNWLDLLRGPHDITLELPLDFAGEVCVKTMQRRYHGLGPFSRREGPVCNQQCPNHCGKAACSARLLPRPRTGPSRCPA